MQEIKGEKFYVSLGYVDEEIIKQQKEFNIRDIKSLIANVKDGTVYLDDSDKENPITLPLMRVKEIQKKDNIFNFRYLFDPYKTLWVNDKSSLLKVNVIGLFGQTVNENGMVSIRHIGFFTVNTIEVKRDKGQTTTFSIEVESSKILGE